MNKFYITKVLAKGNGKAESFVELKPGLNLIQGRSNTGKTCILKCIDFCFGGKNKPFDESLGYTNIELILSTPKGNIQISRSFGKNQVEIITDVNGYENGTYDLKFKKKKKNPAPLLGDLLLYSIGIEDEQFIYKNKYFDTQKMSWRTLLPLLLFSVNNIVKETSVIEPTQGTEKTAFLSSLLFLIYGKKFADIDPSIKKEIRVAKKMAVEEYVNKKIENITEDKRRLEEQLVLFDDIEVEEKIQKIIGNITSIEEKISVATSSNKEILEKIIELQTQDLECNLLQERYATLRSQYISDIKRLSLVVNGEVKLKDVEHNTTCPFCDNNILKKRKQSYIKSAQAELHRITRQMNGLIETEKELLAEKEDISKQLLKLNEQRCDMEKIIQEDLQPQADALKKTLDAYQTYIQIQLELNVISNFVTVWEKDLRELTSEEETKLEYYPKNLFDEIFQEKIDSLLKKGLSECKFPNLTTARLNLSSFDIEINGRKKQNFNGQGYTSFLNSIVAMSFRQYLSENAQYDPGFLVIDTPLLGLDQGVADLSPKSMRTSLYTYFTNHQNCGQVILIDNTKNIPEIDFKSKGVNVIKFTKGLEPGRYGFLMDVTD